MKASALLTGTIHSGVHIAPGRVLATRFGPEVRLLPINLKRSSLVDLLHLSGRCFLKSDAV